MNVVVVVDRNWAIGAKGKLLFHIPEDLEHFRDITYSHCVVYGSETLKTFPGEKPLPGRSNIILTRSEMPEINALIAHNLDELAEILCKYHTEQVFVIGGASVYEQLLAYCDTAYVTKVNASIGGADAFFPDLDSKESSWRLINEGAPQKSRTGYQYRFLVYKNEGMRKY